MDTKLQQNIYQKIATATIEIKNNHTVKKEKNFNLGYSTLTARDVINACREELPKLGIVFSVENVSIEHIQYQKTRKNGHEHSSHYFIIKGDAVFTNADNSNDKMITTFYGSAEDESDKAIGKANTYAKKIALMNTFFLYDDEDTDNTASTDNEGINKEINNKQIYTPNKPPSKPFEIRLEGLTEDEIANLITAKFTEAVSYKDKTTPVLKKWVLVEKEANCKEYLDKMNLTYDVGKGFYVKKITNL